MENQINIGDQNSKQMGQNPVNQQGQILEKPKVNYWMVSTLILFVILVVSGIYTVNLKNKQIVDNLKFSIPTPASYSREIPTEAPSQQPIPTPTISFFQWVKDKGCNYESDALTIEQAENGMCKATNIPCRDQGVPPAYSIIYPFGWKIEGTGGPGYMNLYLARSEKESTGIGASYSEYSLEQISELLYDREEWWAHPVLSPDDKLLSKNYITVGNKKVLVLVIQVKTQNGQIAQEKMYLFKDPTDTTVYGIRFEDTDYSKEYLDFIKEIEKIIESMEFIPDKVNEGC